MSALMDGEDVLELHALAPAAVRAASATAAIVRLLLRIVAS
jgi:hypothetical protein